MLKKKFINLPINKKIQLIIITNVIMIGLFFFIALYFISTAHKDVIFNTLASSLTYPVTELAKSLDSINAIANNVFSHNSIQESLVLNKHSTQKSEKRYCESTIYSILSDFVYNYKYIGLSYISIFQEDDLFTNSLTSMSELPKEVTERLIQKGQASKGASTWVTDYCDTYGLFLVKEIHSIKNLSLENLGVMIINIDIKKVISFTSISELGDGNANYLLYYDDFLMASSDTLTREDAHLLIQKTADRHTIISLNSNDYFCVQGKVPQYDWNLIITVSYHSLLGTISYTQTLWIIILTFCILFSMLLSSFFTNTLVKHLSLLVLKMKAFGNNTYVQKNTNIFYKQRKDEIGILHNTFDSMVNEIYFLIEKNYKNELLKKEAQIKAMESQMDPHFLYNTLDSINWTAKSLGSTTISEITIALANLLRITLNSDTTHFTIQQEITTLNYYFTIQKARYQKRLNYQINIPEELWACEIPKLTLQPLVENSIRYGLETMLDICHITLNAHVEENDIIIDVKNNGSFFEDDMLHKLLAKDIRPNGFGVGMLNIHRRLQLTYGSDYGLTLFNQINPETGDEYALVRVKIPKITI